MLKHSLTKLLFLSLALGLAACGKDDDAPAQSHGEPAADCTAIGEVCTHDVLTTLGEECHEISHENDAAVCSERKAECVSHCSAELNAGGAGGDGGAGGAAGAHH